MQQVKLYKSPAEHVFSQNPIVFGFRVTPFNIANIATRQRIVYSIQFASNANGYNSSTIFQGYVYPDANGLCTIDISTVIDAQLVYFVPNHIIEKVYKCEGQCGWFTITYYLQEGTALVSAQQTTSKFYAYKGGVAKKDLDKASSFLNDTLYTAQTPLHYFVSREPVRLGQFRWIFFIMKFDAADKFEVAFKLFENEGPVLQMSGASVSQQSGKSIQHQLYCFPINLANEALQDAVDTNFRLVSKIEFKLTNGNGTVVYVPTQTFYVDHRNYYEIHFLQYRNSIGALESIALLGEKEFSSSIKKNTTERVEIASEIGDFKLQAEQVDYNNTHRVITRANTGFVTKEEVQRLTDLLINRQNYQFYGTRLIPVYILANSVALYKSTDKLYNLVFDMAIAEEDEHYTPDGIITFSTACPTIDYLDVTQEISEYLFISYKLPSGYNKIHIEATYEYTIASVNYTFTYDLYYNKNMDTVPVFPNLPIPSGENPQVTVTLKGRVVCNDEVAPFSYGAWSSNVVYNYYTYRAPIAVDDYADISPRNTDMRILKKNNQPLKILENDIPANFPVPDFDSFVTSAGAPTATSQNGAAVLYNANGEVEYTPSGGSVANLNADFIFYKCKETVGGIGTLVSNIGQIAVPLDGEIPVIFVKTTALNQIETQHKYGLLNIAVASSWTADMYLEFFADAACTIPIDVTNLGIDVEYNIFSNFEEYNNFGSLINSGGPTLASNTTVTCSGFSMLILPNYDWVAWNSGAQTLTFFHFQFDIGSANYLGVLPTW